MITRRKQYPDLYSWSHPLGSHVFAHQDGAVSVYIDWAGYDLEMMSELERRSVSEALLTALNTILPGYCAEFHFWREWDASLAVTYRNRKIQRGGEFAKAIREAQADHLANYGMSNQVGLVLTKEPIKAFWGGARTALKNQSRAANVLIEAAGVLASKLPGGRLAPLQRYFNRIWQSYDRRRHLREGDFRYDPGFLISESILAEAPSNKADDHILIGGERSKVLLLFLYPDVTPGWFLFLSTLSIPLHISFVLRSTDKTATLQQAERESRLAEGTASERGAEDRSTKIAALSDFRAYIVANNLPVFQNSFIIHLHGSMEENKRYTTLISDWIQRNKGQIRDQDEIQHPYWRTAQPGQGYRSPMWRPDEGEQISNMIPAQVFKSGEANPESLRLGESGQLIGFSRLTDTIAHSFTVAKTGSGKGQDKIATIAETYALGMNWCIAEVGNTYSWVVEGFDGSYTQIDPGDTVVNPLPLYALADKAALPPLKPAIIGPTLGSLAFLLTDGRSALSVHEEAAAQSALQLLYAAPVKGAEAPVLPDLYHELEKLNSSSQEQKDAADSMAKNLYSFLSTTEGRIFTEQTNLKLTEGITGVDLKNVERASPKLLKFYLIFLALQFDHFAFGHRNPTTILLDEMHKFIRIAPDEIGKLISELARMGRKDAGNIDIVTQGTTEIDAIEKEVINSMQFRSLMYRGDEWEDIGKRINMPEAPLHIWKGFRDPMKFSWRPSIQAVGSEYYHLHLTFPDCLLDLGNSNPKDLDQKDRIAKQIKDPIKRLQLFRQYKEGMLA